MKKETKKKSVISFSGKKSDGIKTVSFRDVVKTTKK